MLCSHLGPVTLVPFCMRSGKRPRCPAPSTAQCRAPPRPPPQLLYERTVGSGVGVLTNLVDGMCRWVGAVDQHPVWPSLLAIHPPWLLGWLPGGRAGHPLARHAQRGWCHAAVLPRVPAAPQHAVAPRSSLSLASRCQTCPYPPWHRQRVREILVCYCILLNSQKPLTGALGGRVGHGPAAAAAPARPGVHMAASLRCRRLLASMPHVPSLTLLPRVGAAVLCSGRAG